MARIEPGPIGPGRIGLLEFASLLGYFDPFFILKFFNDYNIF